jgi:hypothetical protein
MSHRRISSDPRHGISDLARFATDYAAIATRNRVEASMKRYLLHPSALAVVALAILTGCATAPQSSADKPSQVMNTPTVGEIAEFLESKGHSPRLEATEAGDPRLIVNEGGDNFLTLFYDCTEGGGLAARRCTGIEFSVTYPVEKKPTLSQINKMNARYRMAKAYMNTKGEPGVSVALNTGGAFSSKNLEDGLDWWIAAMRGFEKDIGWN